MRNIKKAVLLWLFYILFISQIASQNIGVSGSFVPSTIEECQTSDLTIFFSNEDFTETIMAGEAMISVIFPATGEYSTPQSPPTGMNPSIFTWTLIGNTWKGMLAGDVPPLSDVDIVFEVTAINVTGGTNSDLLVVLNSGVDLNQVNNMANPSLEIIESTAPIVDTCPDQDQGTFSCIDEVTDPALTIEEFEALFGNGVLNPDYCGDLTLTFNDDTTSMNQGCAMDPIVISRTYVFEGEDSSDSCQVQYTIIDDVSPQISCKDITIELDENGTYTINPEDLSDGVINTCNGMTDESVTFTVSQPTFDCSDLDLNGQNCANTISIKLYAEDACGNIDSCDANITVVDNTPPIINCPSDMTIGLEGGECSAQHFFLLPEATDNCDGFDMFNTTTTITQVSGTDLSSGDFYEPGTYTWTYEAEDGCGNTSECTFSLDVLVFPNTYLLSLACNDLLNISLDLDCEVELGADMILEGGPYKCYDDYIIEIEGVTGTIITTPGFYTVTITDSDTGNSCWSTINVEGKSAPIIEDCACPVGGTELTTPFEGTLDATDAIWTRPFVTGGVCNPSGTGIDIPYDTYSFGLDMDATLGAEVVSFTAPSGDSFLALYEEIFDPSDPCGNLVITNDDGGIGLLSQFNVMLNTGVTYILVVTTFNENGNDYGDYVVEMTSDATLLEIAEECNFRCVDVEFVMNSSELTPNPTATSCVEYELAFSDQLTVDANGNQIILRTWFASNANGFVTCVQQFNFAPIAIGDLMLPISPVELSCNNGISPEEIAAIFDNPLTTDNPNTSYVENNEGYVYGYPTYLVNGHPQKVDNNICDLYAGYTDQELSACEEGCSGNRKVIRTWTLVDWSTLETSTYVQTIKAVDTEAPTLITQDITVSTDPWTCEASFDVPAPWELHDNCDDSPKYNLSGPAGVTIEGTFQTGFMVSGAPKGTHTFNYIAYDCCGNDANYPFTVNVVDLTPPVVVAKQNIVISLTVGSTSDDGFAKLYTESVDNGSYDGCSDNVKLEVRREEEGCDVSGNTTYNADGHPQDGSPNPQSPSYDPDGGAYVKFCCDDINSEVVDVDGDGVNDAGYHKVWLRVWDDGDMDGIYGTDGDNYNEAWAFVKVEDKLAPAINCPTDVTIACDMDFTDTGATGVASAYGSCGGVEVEYNDIIINLNTCNEGFVRRRWNVVGRSDIFCDQTITMTGVNAPVNVSFSQVGDFTAVNCPDDIAVGEPTWIAGACDVMGYTVATDTFKFEDGACYKLVNRYSVINWCDYAPNNPFWNGEGLWEHVQIIKVTDETKPVIADCEDKMYEVNDHSDSDDDGIICEASVILTNIAIDEGSANCPTGWLKWQVEVDLWGDGTPDYEYSSFLPPFDSQFNDTNGNGIGDVYLSPTMNGETVSIALPDIEGSMSNHKVSWTVTDGCNNVTTCNTEFMVVDKKAPTPYCIDISSAVMENNGTVELWAIDFNIGSYDNCTLSEDLNFTFTDTPPSNDISFDPEQNSSKKVFGCDDVLNSPIELNMYVWDEKGNFDFCMVALSLIDNSGDCGQGMNINGTIATEYGKQASNIEIKLNSYLPEYPRVKTTNVNGSYSFSGIPINADYEISANNNEDYLNGVSTLDLVKIQRHVLGLEDLDSPYKLIAADVNNDYKLKANDLLLLRKLILGTITELPNNDSWRFVDASQELDMDTDLQNVSYVRTILNLQSNMEGIDLVAVKIGDVSENADFIIESQISTRSSKEVLLQFEDRDIKQGEEVQVEVKSSNYTNILGFQFTLNLDGLSFLKLDSGKILFNTENIGVHDENTISISYNSINAISSENNDVLFTLNFIAKKDGTIGEMLFLNSKITSSEGYVEQKTGEIETTTLRLGAIDEHNKSAINELYQNLPNPFKENTIIGFELAKKENVKFIIQDFSGRIVKNTTIQAKKGYNEISLNSNEFSSKGIFIYKIESNQFTKSKKMIIVE